MGPISELGEASRGGHEGSYARDLHDHLKTLEFIPEACNFQTIFFFSSNLEEGTEGFPPPTRGSPTKAEEGDGFL